MKIFKNKLLIIISFLILAVAIFGINQMITVRKAHSTFANYYAFRGCSSLIKKTNTYAFCKLPSSQIIKIVKFQNRWYLDNDLPFCLANFCL